MEAAILALCADTFVTVEEFGEKLRLKKISRVDAQVAVRFAAFTAAEQQLIMQKFAIERKVMEVPRHIAAMTKERLRH